MSTASISGAETSLGFGGELKTDIESLSAGAATAVLEAWQGHAIAKAVLPVIHGAAETAFAVPAGIGLFAYWATVKVSDIFLEKFGKKELGITGRKMVIARHAAKVAGVAAGIGSGLLAAQNPGVIALEAGLATVTVASIPAWVPLAIAGGVAVAGHWAFSEINRRRKAESARQSTVVVDENE